MATLILWRFAGVTWHRVQLNLYDAAGPDESKVGTR